MQLGNDRVHHAGGRIVFRQFAAQFIVVGVVYRVGTVLVHLAGPPPRAPDTRRLKGRGKLRYARVVR